MKKLIQAFLCLFLLILFCESYMFAATNKTFLMPRPVGVNLAMEYTSWNSLTNYQKERGVYQGNLQVTPFYQSSTNKSALGKYFGVEKKNNFILKDQKVGINELASQRDACADNIFHMYNTLNNGNRTDIKLGFDQDAYGVRLDYYQVLGFLSDRAYFKVSLPLVHVKNGASLSSSNFAGVFSQELVSDYFNGKDISASLGTGNEQAALIRSKINGSHSKTGVADLDFITGYTFIDKWRGRLSINLGLTVPTGNKPNGEYAFEPIVGNAGQWGFGAGVDGSLSFSVGNNNKLNLSLVANFRYFFEDTQRRTVGINGDSMGLEAELPAINNFNQYYLLGKVGDPAGTPLTPAANVLAIDVHARSGAQLDTIFNINYTNAGFTLDLGYNLFWKEAESLTLTSGSWADEQYAIAKNNLNVATLASGTITAHEYFEIAKDAQGAKAINSRDLDLERAASQSQVTHKAYLGFGYIFKRYKRPWMLGLAGSYEFADRNALANWALWCKAGVAF